ncbi:hypothetical protein GSI_08338 [Ganoderma sinense ZZ0214-1]|uniref:O-methyltransferase C-terminal domain-containing protein n=1 Tax=Ganoderma sinense ZZ0214-1 TaxID=1077348 RepID=A0A2G8S6X9_9APHY|nr:hypothetical protein GSI_08338 [Ganoderma sinense ZZ0214-1]
MTFSTLRALHAVIGAAIDDIELVYRERSDAQGSTLEYPSLDEPYYHHAAQHTPEEELAEELKADPAVAAATKRIVAACSQLSTTVNKPWFGLMEDMLWAQFSSAIRFLEAANIVEILREAGPNGLHVQEILRLVLELRTNSKTATPTDTVPLTPAHLSHILRLLATGHYLREVKPDVFTNNRPSSYIDSGKTVSQLREAPEKKYNDTNGIAAYVGVAGDESLKFMTTLVEWALPEKRRGTDTNFDYRAPPPAGGHDRSASTDSDSEGAVVTPRYVAPFHVAFNTQLNLFAWYELPENEGRLARFGHAMVGTRQCESKDEILRGFSWEDLPRGSVLVDVGGGIGAQAVVVANAHPHIRVVVEDRAQVVAGAREAWGPQYAHLFESGRMSWRVYDFFEAWPPLLLPGLGTVDAPDVFLLRGVLHDWTDENCKRQLLIGDMLLQHACADAAAYDTADGSAATFPFVTRDSPLLPNLGVANILGYITDLMMMDMFDAKERTVAEMTALTQSTGWKIIEVRRTPGAIWGYTTAVPV